MKPTVGRIVHYTNLGDRDGKYPPEIQAAIITKAVKHIDAPPQSPVEEQNFTVSLKAFYPTGFFDMADVKFTPEAAGSDGARGSWTWPAREGS